MKDFPLVLPSKNCYSTRLRKGTSRNAICVFSSVSKPELQQALLAPEVELQGILEKFFALERSIRLALDSNALNIF